MVRTLGFHPSNHGFDSRTRYKESSFVSGFFCVSSNLNLLLSFWLKLFILNIGSGYPFDEIHSKILTAFFMQFSVKKVGRNYLLAESKISLQIFGLWRLSLAI